MKGSTSSEPFCPRVPPTNKRALFFPCMHAQPICTVMIHICQPKMNMATRLPTDDLTSKAVPVAFDCLAYMLIATSHDHFRVGGEFECISALSSFLPMLRLQCSVRMFHSVCPLFQVLDSHRSAIVALRLFCSTWIPRCMNDQTPSTLV